MGILKNEHVIVVGLAVLAILLVNTMVKRNVPVLSAGARIVQTGL